MFSVAEFFYVPPQKYVFGTNLKSRPTLNEKNYSRVGVQQSGYGFPFVGPASYEAEKVGMRFFGKLVSFKISFLRILRDNTY